MKLKIIKKYVNLPEAFIERRMPAKGKISVKVGETVNSYDQIGEANYSLESEKVTYTGEVAVKEGDRVYPSDLLACEKKYVVKKTEYRTNISGRVAKIDEKSSFIEIKSLPKKFDLISGVTGEVVDVSNNISVLIKSPASVARAVDGCGSEVGGEIIVLKESELIDDALISEKVAGKIIFANTITDSAIKKARTFGCTGFVIASCEYSQFKKWSSEDVSLLVTEGFGKLQFNTYLVQLLDQLTSKFALLRTHDKDLVLPVDKENGKFYFPANKKEEFEAEASAGDRVYILSRSLFGTVAKIVQVNEKEGTLKLNIRGNTTEIPSDIVALIG